VPKVPRGKRVVTVYIDESLLDDLYSIIHLKYRGRLRGVLSRVFEEALKLWLDANRASPPPTPERDLSESNHGVTPSAPQGVTPTANVASEGVTPTKLEQEEEAVGAWSPLCGLWDRIKDRVEFSEYMYNEFRKLLESLLPGFNSNELIEEFESCGIIEVSGNVIRVKQ